MFMFFGGLKGRQKLLLLGEPYGIFGSIADSKPSRKGARTKMPLAPRGFLPIVGMAPNGSGAADFIIAKDRILGDFRETRNRSKQLDGFLVPAILAAPSWVDLKNPGKDDSLVYCGLPSGRYLQDTSIEVPSPPGKVFAVYISGRKAAGGQRVVDSWEWIEADPERADLPLGYQTRLGSQLWSRD